MGGGRLRGHYLDLAFATLGMVIQSLLIGSFRHAGKHTSAWRTALGDEGRWLMIVARVAGGGTSDPLLRVVTQSDHAHLGAEILRLWRTDDLPEHPRRATILFAVREHDNGWREYDAAPRIDPETGRLRDFRTTAGPDRREIWQRGTCRYRTREPAAALLILAHARRLHADRAGAPAWRSLFEAWRALETDLLVSAGTDADAVAADDHWVDLADTISLALADRWHEPLECRERFLSPQPATSPDGVDTLGLDPFPLAGATTFTLPCRYLADRSFSSDLDLALALAEARWDEARVRLVPARKAAQAAPMV